jgi:competence protein ComEA
MSESSPAHGVASSPSSASPFAPPANLSPSLPAVQLVWPRSAQATAAALLLLACILLGWYAYQAHSSTARPTALEEGRSGLFRVELNTADRSQLLQLPGVGEALATRIEERRRVAPFRTVEELRQVPGIGPILLERLRSFVTVERLDDEEDEEEPPLRPVRPAPVKKSADLTKALDLNRASPEDLQRLPGIGPKLATRIVSARPFKRIDDLRRVSGIGVKTLEKLRPLVFVENAP